MLLSIVLLAGGASAANNGVALTPPMGWRSWNCFGGNVDQQKMEGIMDRMSERVRSVDGTPTSFKDLGYDDCGLDDNYQACGTGQYGSFHDAQGNNLINTKTFPDMKSMTSYGHARGLKIGFYMNNCICSEHQFKTAAEIETHMRGDVRDLIKYGFDGVKLDGCGQFLNLTWWYELINATGKAMFIENCHWGNTVPGQATGNAPCRGTEPVSLCPYNIYRTSGDIRNTWQSMNQNLQTTKKFQGDIPLSRPGTWAYPDMMEVGRMPTVQMDRTHFGAWVITSSPLILGYDLNNQAVNDRVWPFVANKEAIAINQAWAGHPGKQVLTWNPSNITPGNSKFVVAVKCSNSARQKSWTLDANAKAIKWTNLCLDARDTRELQLFTCSGSAQQQFTFNAQTKAIMNNNQCVDVYNNAGPVVELYSCHNGQNQRWTFNADGSVVDEEEHCLEAADVAPGADGMELWAKPLGGGSVAALAFSGLSAGSYEARISFDTIGLTPGRSFHVRDVWARKDLGTFSGSYTTPAIGPYDSVLLRFTPA